MSDESGIEKIKAECDRLRLELTTIRAAVQNAKDYIDQRAQEGYHAIDSGAVLSRLKGLPL